MSRRARVATALFAAVLVGAGLAAFTGDVESHSGHPQKKLFDERWHYQPDGDYDAWMDLTTSDVWLNCDGAASACGDVWFEPFDAALTDWNSQPTTVRFSYDEGVRDMDFDVNVIVYDEVPGNPGLLGLAEELDEDGDQCFFSGCQVYAGRVLIGDDTHNGAYGSDTDRQATISHEIGHIVQLRHESEDDECGMDGTGEVPQSIMAYDCIDPPEVGGEGIYLVQPWDACGVNHAYYDPAFGYAGCGDTTTPTPTPARLVWGDANCSGESNPIDSLLTLRYDAQLSVSQPPGCPVMGSEVNDGVVGAASLRLWGDVDCSGALNPVDSLKVLRRDAGLSVFKVDPSCLDIGAGFDPG